MQIEGQTRGHGDAENLFSRKDARYDLAASPRLRFSESILKWIVRVCRFGLAALFLFTAGAKLWILKKFASIIAKLLSSASINYQRWQWPATIGVITAEKLRDIARKLFQNPKL